MEEIEKDVLRFYDAAPLLPKKDWVLIVKGKKSLNRTSPAIHVLNSKDFSIENVTVHHAGGMGFIAERTENVKLESFNVRLPEGSQRMVTTTADATHFVNCRGKVELANCLFENQLDDPSNIHGIYFPIHKVMADNKLLIKLGHVEQWGVTPGFVGDEIGIIDNKTF